VNNHQIAAYLQSKGREGDAVLVHMSPSEVEALQILAETHGGTLTINPETGLLEANFLKSILPMVAGVAAMFIPGLQGVGATMIAGAMAGGVTAMATGQDTFQGMLGGAAGASMAGAAGIGAGAGGAGAGAGAAGLEAAMGTGAATESGLALGLESTAGGWASAAPAATPLSSASAVPMAEAAGLGASAEAGALTGVGLDPAFLATSEGAAYQAGLLEGAQAASTSVPGGGSSGLFPVGESAVATPVPTATATANGTPLGSATKQASTAQRVQRVGQALQRSGLLNEKPQQGSRGPMPAPGYNVPDTPTGAPVGGGGFAPQWRVGAANVSTPGASRVQPTPGFTQVPRRFASGGLAGDGMESGAFVIPADVVSAAGNGSTQAGLRALGQAIPGLQAIQGPGDGLSDSIPTHIDGKKPAAVADGEAYISPDNVRRVGSGNATRGAQRLYSLMDRVRHAAHGSSQQQKPVELNKVGF
jgi:hypothetical protein